MLIGSKIGIAIFAYNRPSHLRRVLIAIEDYKIKNPINIFLDGPKKNSDKILQKEIKFLIKTNRNLKIRLNISKKNNGIKKSLNKNLDKMTKKYDFVIILEDDTIPRKDFFFFIQKIIKYRLDEKSAAICGYQLPSIHMKNKKIINFVRLNNFIPWGWAVRSDYWKKYRKDSSNSKKQKFKDLKSNIIKKILIKIRNKKSKIWSIDFMLYNFIHKKDYIFPTKSLIKNIGFDGSGINCGISDKFITYHTESKKIDFKTILKNQKIQYKQDNSLIKLYKYFY